RLFNQDVLAGSQSRPRALEVPVVRGGNANDVDRVLKQPARGILPRKAGKVSDAPARLLLVALCPLASPARHGREFNLHQAEVAPVETFGVQLLEQGTIGLVEDHAETDHARMEPALRTRWRNHALMIGMKTPDQNVRNDFRRRRKADVN